MCGGRGLSAEECTENQMIYTLTLSPSFDVHAFTQEFRPFAENLVTLQVKQSGGKGVNLSRALTCVGVENLAVVLLGKENGQEFKEGLQGLHCRFLEVAGRIRENLTIHCENGHETRISYPGFAADEEILQQLSFAPGDIVTMTGRSAIETDKLKAFLKEQDVKIVLDSKSFTLEDIYDLKPWLVKPNEEELEGYFGATNIYDAARQLQNKGICHVLISQGGDGALLAAEGRFWKAIVPAVDVVSTVGAGDSMTAGFLAAYEAGKDYEECLKTAVSFGTAACMEEGTSPPDMNKVREIYELITVEEQFI